MAIRNAKVLSAAQTVQEFWGEENLPTTGLLRMGVYGAPGVGKSSLGATMPGPRLVVGADPNAFLPLNVTFETRPRIYAPPEEVSRRPAGGYIVRSWTEVMAVLDKLDRDVPRHGIQSVIIDSISAISDICVSEIRESQGVATLDPQIRKQDYGILYTRLDSLRARIHALPCHVLWLAGIRQVNEGTETAKRLRLFPDLVGSSAQKFPHHLGVLAYMDRTRKGEETICQLRTAPDEEVYAKDNFGVLDYIEEADMYVLMAKLGFVDPLPASAVVKKKLPAPTPGKTPAAGRGGAPAGKSRDPGFDI